MAKRGRLMPDFLTFIEGNVIHILEMKAKKDGIHLSDDWS